MIKFTDGKNIYTLTDMQEILGMEDKELLEKVSWEFEDERYKKHIQPVVKSPVEILKGFNFQILEDTSDEIYKDLSPDDVIFY